MSTVALNMEGPVVCPDHGPRLFVRDELSEWWECPVGTCLHRVLDETPHTVTRWNPRRMDL